MQAFLIAKAFSALKCKFKVLFKSFGKLYCYFHC